MYNFVFELFQILCVDQVVFHYMYMYQADFYDLHS